MYNVSHRLFFLSWCKVHWDTEMHLIRTFIIIIIIIIIIIVVIIKP